MQRFSIRTLMAVVVLSALSLAALRNANKLWAGLTFMVALSIVGIAMVGAVIMRGKERCWWATFAFFGGSYLVLTCAPGFSTVVSPKLVTTTALDYLHSEFVSSSTE